MKQQSNEPQAVVNTEECQDLARIMGIKYAANLKGRFFTVEVRSDADIAEVKVTLQNDEQSFYYPVEGRIEHRQQNLAPRDATLLLVDYVDSYFEEYLREDEGVYLPLDWGPFQLDGIELQLKGQVLNLKAEAMADQFLAAGRSGHEL